MPDILKDNIGSDNSTIWWNGAARWYMAGCWTTGSAYTLNKISVELRKNGGVAGNVGLEIWSNNVNVPGAVLGVSPTTYVANNLPAGLTFMLFDGLIIPLTAATRYWIVLTEDTVPAGSNMSWGVNSTIGFATSLMSSTNKVAFVGLLPWTPSLKTYMSGLAHPHFRPQILV